MDIESEALDVAPGKPQLPVVGGPIVEDGGSRAAALQKQSNSLRACGSAARWGEVAQDCLRPPGCWSECHGHWRCVEWSVWPSCVSTV